MILTLDASSIEARKAILESFISLMVDGTYVRVAQMFCRVEREMKSATHATSSSTSAPIPACELPTASEISKMYTNRG